MRKPIFFSAVIAAAISISPALQAQQLGEPGQQPGQQQPPGEQQPGQPQPGQPAPGQQPGQPAPGQQPQQPAPGQQPGQPGLPGAAAPQQADVVAMVNDDVVTQAELQATVQMQLQGRPADAQQAAQIQQEVLTNLIESRLVEQYLREEGPEVPEQEVDEIVGQLRQQVEAQGLQFEQFLAGRGMSVESLEKRLMGSLAWEKYREEQTTEEDLRQFHEENQQLFGQAEFEQVQPQVGEAYAAELWQKIVEEKRPDAEIRVMGPQQPQQPQPVPQQPAPQRAPGQP